MSRRYIVRWFNAGLRDARAGLEPLPYRRGTLKAVAYANGYACGRRQP